MKVTLSLELQTQAAIILNGYVKPDNRCLQFWSTFSWRPQINVFCFSFKITLSRKLVFCLFYRGILKMVHEELKLQKVKTN